MEPGKPDAVGRRLRQYREARGLTQEALAQLTVFAVSVRTIGNIERGTTEPYGHTLDVLTRALELGQAEREALLTQSTRATRGVAADDAASARPGRGRLPVPLTELVGRAAEVADVTALLQRQGVRLVTLTGPGGVGKTRVAIAAAAHLAADFPDGVVFVSLASLDQPTFVPRAIAQALGVRERGGQGLVEAIAQHLRERRLLLVLDNFEHVAPAAPVVATILEACPDLRVLATSRALLRLRGERCIALSPLALPPVASQTRADLDRSPATALFVQRAQEVKADFAPADAEVPTIAEICRRLDGLPLAIELAAVRIAVLPPSEMLARLEPALPLLSGGLRDLPGRQQTLRATFAWSYDLLQPEAQVVFRRLAVFRGGATLESVEAVCTAGGSSIPMLEEVTALAEQSLVQLREVGGQPRVQQLETVREFALERLMESGEEAPTRAAHASYFLVLAEATEPDLTGQTLPACLEQFDREHDNVRAALRWFLQREEAEPALRLAAVLAHVWYLRGHPSEARAALEAALALPGAEESTLPRARALLALGQYALWRLGEYDRGRAAVEEGLIIARALGDRPLMTAALRELGREAVHQGDFRAAPALLEESLGLCRELDDPRGIAWSLTFLGELASFQGDISRAESDLHEGLTLFRRLDDPWGIAGALLFLARVATDQGDHATAHARLTAVVRSPAARAPWVFAYPLQEFAHLAAAQGQARRALRLAGAAAGLRRQFGSPLPRAWAADAERRLAAARQALGDAAADAAWAEGEAMSLPEAIAEADRSSRSESPIGNTRGRSPRGARDGQP